MAWVRIVCAVGVKYRQLPSRWDHLDRLEIRDHPSIRQRPGVAGRRAGCQQAQCLEHRGTTDQIHGTIAAAVRQRGASALAEAIALQHDAGGANRGQPRRPRLAARGCDHAHPRGASELEAGEPNRRRRAPQQQCVPGLQAKLLK